MKSLWAMPFVLFYLIVSFGCGLTDLQDPNVNDVRFEVEKTIYQKDETVEARFINDSKETIYIVSFGTCASILQKRSETGWGSLYLPDMACLTVISYRPFAVGEVETFSITPEFLGWLVEESEGTYRLRLHIAPSENFAEAEAVVSPTFQIVG